MTDVIRSIPRRAAPALLAAALALPALMPAPAMAQSGPTSPYQADRIFQDERGEKVKTTFYFTRTRQRLDYLVGAQRVITIVDQPAKRIVILYPRRKTKQTRPYAAPAWDFGLSQPGATFTAMGPEKVGDIVAIKYKAQGKAPDGQVFDGFAWLTSERIVVKLDGTVRRGKATKRFFMTTENLKVGEPNPRLFLVPPDYAELKGR